MHNRRRFFYGVPPVLKRTVILLSVATASAGAHAVDNGFPSTHEVEAGKGMTELQAMLWKYTARCALRPDQELAAPARPGEMPHKFPGAIGVAPEWYGGTCDRACQEKVSSCLFALTNRTGKHVAVSLLSAAPNMSAALLPSENDIDYSHQEGAFFGSAFGSGEAYACQGTAIRKAPQVKRFCAGEPATCSGLARFSDAGRCQDVCQMTCKKLSDGSERCAATSCRDPGGRTWAFPITTYLRNQIEASNADAVSGAIITDEGLTELDDGDTATWKGVDFGASPGGVHRFIATLGSARSGGRIEIWIDGQHRIGTLTIKASRGEPRPQEATLTAGALSGEHDVTLKFLGGKSLGRLTTIELR